MKLRQTSQLILLFMVLLIAGSCAPESQPTPTAPVDKPYLSSQEAISIAKREAVANYAWAYSESSASYCASFSEGWYATYTGNGKWTVDLRLRNEDGSITIHRWSVFETNLAAVYLGAYKGD